MFQKWPAGGGQSVQSSVKSGAQRWCWLFVGHRAAARDGVVDVVLAQEQAELVADQKLS